MDAGTDRKDWIGVRVAYYRELLGLTQDELGARIGHSRQYVSMIEHGKRPVTTRRLINALAEALHVTVAALLARPERLQSDHERYLGAILPEVRAALDGPDDMAVPATPALVAGSQQLMRLRMACDYVNFAAALPTMLAQAHLATELRPDDPDAWRAFAEICATASLALRPTAQDLGMRLAERALLTATHLDDAPTIGAAQFAHAQACFAGGVRGLTRRSYRVASRAAQALSISGENTGRLWYGMLHLQSALSAAGLGEDHDTVLGHLSEARAVAPTLIGDPWWMELSEANVDCWTLAVELEAGGDVDAVRLTRSARHGLRSVQRQAHLFMFLGRWYYLHGDHTRAISAFSEAKTISADEVRRPSVREIVGWMIRDARSRAGSTALQQLALHVGVDPDADLET